MRQILSLLTFALIIIGLPAPSPAQTPDNLVQIRLLAEKSQINANEDIWIGIEQTITPEWHTYWVNPGDSGTATTANWRLPEGFAIGDIQWPIPEKLPYGPLLNYGYENTVTLLQKLTVPAEIPEGAFTLTADIELLVCKEECIPEYGTYTLTLNAPETTTEDNSTLFADALSKLPSKSEAHTAAFYEQNGNFILEANGFEAINADTIEFLPIDWGIISNSAEQSVRVENNMLTITQARGERSLDTLEIINGLIAFTEQNGTRRALHISATAKPAPITEQPVETTEAAQATNGITIPQALLFALLGGMILNLMPCVFPVLSIKALSLVKIAAENKEAAPHKAKIHGLAYTAGVILSFLAIAAILLILKSAGAGIGWGFQLQNPIVVGSLALLLFAIGLNLSGYFEFGKSISVGNTLTQKQGPSGSFFTGVLATAVATPCTAPFMAGAIGFALTQTAAVNLLVFAALGLGLALPYLALSFTPSLQKIMPKPGAWMDVFKQLLAFPMFLSAVWLTWVLTKQAGATGLLQLLLAASALTFGLWLFKFKRIFAKTLAFIMFATTIGLVSIQSQMPASDTPQAEMTHNTYSPKALQTTLSGDAPVFVEMTADWCITCKVNAAIGINIPATRKAFTDNNVTYLIGDWTNEDPIITQYLENYERNGVPLYVYYGPRDANGTRPQGQVLPQILTPVTLPNLFK